MRSLDLGCQMGQQARVMSHFKRELDKGSQDASNLRRTPDEDPFGIGIQAIASIHRYILHSWIEQNGAYIADRETSFTIEWDGIYVIGR